MPSLVRHVTFDASDPFALATFWAQVLGGRTQDDDLPGDPSVLVTHRGTPLLFEQVPEARSGKNRLHLDLDPEQGRDQEVRRLVELGAQLVADRTRPDGTGWVVLADPEGNELCVERSAAERGRAPVDTGDRDLAPLHAADERPLLLGMLEWYREGVLLKVHGAAQRDAVTSPLRSGTTMAGLMKHLALVEDHWATHVLAGQPMPQDWAAADFDADPDWEFHSAADEPLEDVVALYRAACDRSRAVVDARHLDDTAVDRRGREVSLRFAVLHLLEETARHLGHLDLLRELADGSTGE